MRDGRLDQVDAPQALYDRPANLFVAAFIGSPAMNLLRGRLEYDGRLLVLLGGERLEIPDFLLDERPELARRIDEEVVVGVRPEAVHVADRATPPGALLELEVVLVEALGSDVLVHLSTDAPRVTVSDAFGGEDEAGLEARFTARLPPGLRVGVGDRLRLGVDVARLHVFDPQTGASLG